MIPFLYLLNVGCSAGQSALGKQYAAKGGKAVVFNLNKALAGSLVFLLFGLLNGLELHLPSWLFGLGYGAALCLSMHTGFKALAMGPMALTSIIASFSLIIPFLFGITVWKEPLTLPGGIGMILLLAAILLLNFKKEDGLSVRWSVYAFLTLAANGACSLIQKYHQICYPGQYRTVFMLAAMLAVLVLLSGAGLGEKQKFTLSLPGLAAGLMNGAANYIVLYLAAAEKASVLFPVVSVANVIAVWLIGRIVFKEKLKGMQLLGLAAGLGAILLLNL
ncbi:MAG: hypothetical protein IJ043_05975 [Clostridia bacterium]|nr:hypothetical protein [Clostridia bacterium]